MSEIELKACPFCGADREWLAIEHMEGTIRHQEGCVHSLLHRMKQLEVACCSRREMALAEWVREDLSMLRRLSTFTGRGNSLSIRVIRNDHDGGNANRKRNGGHDERSKTASLFGGLTPRNLESKGRDANPDPGETGNPGSGGFPPPSGITCTRGGPHQSRESDKSSAYGHIGAKLQESPIATNTRQINLILELLVHAHCALLGRVSGMICDTHTRLVASA